MVFNVLLNNYLEGVTIMFNIICATKKEVMEK